MRIRSVASTTVHVPIPLIGAIVVYALVAFLVYKQYRLIFDISYHIVSLLFMYADGRLGPAGRQGAGRRGPGVTMGHVRATAAGLLLAAAAASFTIPGKAVGTAD